MRLPKKIIDANVILRLLLADDEVQFLKAKAFLEEVEVGKEEVLLTEMVFAEVVWVLNKVYEVPRNQITEKFSSIINYRGLKTIFDKEMFLECLRLYAHSSIDVQDIFLSVLSKARECSVVTFDRTCFKKLKTDTVKLGE